MKFRSLSLLLVIAMGSRVGWSQSVPAPDEADCTSASFSLMVLGTYHFAGSSQDQFSADAGDVRSAEKQAELAALRGRLAGFAPTKIAVEAPFKGSDVARQYAAFLAGEYQLTDNEIDQLGFTLARQLGHPTVYPVDFPMWMDGRVPAEIGVPKPRPEPTPAAGASAATPTAVPEIYLELARLAATRPVIEVLRYLNSPAYMRADHAIYVESLRPDPYSDALYGTSDLVANWYKRNLRIFTNLYRIAEDRDRILLLIGAGHGTILRQLALDARDVCLVDTESYLAEP